MARGLWAANMATEARAAGVVWWEAASVARSAAATTAAARAVATDRVTVAVTAAARAVAVTANTEVEERRLAAQVSVVAEVVADRKAVEEDWEATVAVAMAAVVMEAERAAG